MRGKIVLAGLILGCPGCCCGAGSPGAFRDREISIVRERSRANPSPSDTYVITGEQSTTKITFDEGDYVYVNKGSSQGVKVGDEFSVVRPVKDPYGIEWTKWQNRHPPQDGNGVGG